jgi:hypothetical protein
MSVIQKRGDQIDVALVELRDEPVLPWGNSLYGNNFAFSYVQLAFYRAEGIDIEQIVRVPVSQVVKPRRKPK